MTDLVLHQPAPVPVDISDHPVLIYLAGLGLGSRKTMQVALRNIAKIIGADYTEMTLPWAHLRYLHTQAIRSKLMERLAPSSTNKHLAALRGVLREAGRLGQIGPDDLQRAIDLRPARGDRLPAGREVTSGELRALFEVCAADVNAARGRRDAALLGILYGCGLRRSEAITLEVADVDVEKASTAVKKGKGNKQRLVFLPAGTVRAIAAWLQLRGTEPGALLTAVRKGGTIIMRGVTGQSVEKILRRRAREAKLKTLSPHDMRRSHISHLLDAGADISTVQRMAGHSSVTTTSRYDRRGDVAQRKAVGLLHVPVE